MSTVDADIDHAFLVFETAERNQKCLADWRAKFYFRALLQVNFPDPHKPLSRYLLTRWYAQQREFARLWMARSVFHRRQAG